MTGAAMFGKLPAHGDFVARGIDFNRRERLDAWLTASFDAAKQRYADDWHLRFDRAPPWLFVVRTATGFEAGAVCPSVDKAGRRFPLYAAIATRDAEDLVTLAVHAQEGLYAAIGENMAADDLIGYLDRSTAGEACPVRAPEAMNGGDCWWAVDAEGAVVASLAGAHPHNLLSEMLALSEFENDYAA